MRRTRARGLARAPGSPPKSSRAKSARSTSAPPASARPAKARAPRRGSAAAQLRSFFEYTVYMDEPLNLARDYARALMLAAQGLSAQGAGEDARSLLALGRSLGSELAQVRAQLDTLLLCAREEGVDDTLFPLPLREGARAKRVGEG